MSIETIVTIPRGGEVMGAAFGASCGVVLGKLGLLGLVFAGPMVALAGFAAVFELRERRLSAAEVTFMVGCAVAIWVVR